MSEEEKKVPAVNPGYLPWSEDLEMISKFLDRKTALIEDHSQFVKDHPELGAILADFIQSLLLHKPDDVYKFTYDFFTPYSPILPQNPSHLSQRTATDI